MITGKEIKTTSGNAAAQKARDSLDTYKKKKAVLQENLQNVEKERDYWYGKEKEYSAELSKSNVEQVKAAKKERDRIESSLKREKERLRYLHTWNILLTLQYLLYFHNLQLIQAQVFLLDQSSVLLFQDANPEYYHS